MNNSIDIGVNALLRCVVAGPMVGKGESASQRNHEQTVASQKLHVSQMRVLVSVSKTMESPFAVESQNLLRLLSKDIMYLQSTDCLTIKQIQVQTYIQRLWTSDSGYTQPGIMFIDQQTSRHKH